LLKPNRNKHYSDYEHLNIVISSST